MIDPCKHAGPDCRGKVSHAACGCGYVAARCEAHGGRQQANHSLGCHMVWHRRRGKPLDENAYTQIRRILHGLLAEGGPPSLLVALTTPGTFAIAEERQRQIASEGWTPEHDDEHAGGEMARAGAAYALVAGGMQPDAALARIWPWAGRWWKPRTVAGARTDENRIRDLTRAGALIAAEIDRLIRARGAK